MPCRNLPPVNSTWYTKITLRRSRLHTSCIMYVHTAERNRKPHKEALTEILVCHLFTCAVHTARRRWLRQCVNWRNKKPRGTKRRHLPGETDNVWRPGRNSNQISCKKQVRRRYRLDWLGKPAMWSGSASYSIFSNIIRTLFTVSEG